MTKDPRYRWLALALVVWAAAWGVTRWRSTPPPAEPPAWQRPLSSLTVAQQRQHRALREAIVVAEKARDSGAWPAALIDGFPLSKQGLHVNYVGEAEGLRWLVLLVEPDPRLPPDPSPLDDEHHRLADGSMLHVSVWTQALTEARARHVIAWPASEGWTEPR